jgi:hypothetical protein
MHELDNEMDDLFRQAAENYKLKAGDGDWEKVYATLRDKPAQSSLNNDDRKFISSGLILLLFLVTLTTGMAVKIVRMNGEQSAPVVIGTVDVRKKENQAEASKPAFAADIDSGTTIRQTNKIQPGKTRPTGSAGSQKETDEYKETPGHQHTKKYSGQRKEWSTITQLEATEKSGIRPKENMSLTKQKLELADTNKERNWKKHNATTKKFDKQEKIPVSQGNTSDRNESKDKTVVNAIPGKLKTEASAVSNEIKLNGASETAINTTIPIGVGLNVDSIVLEKADSADINRSTGKKQKKNLKGLVLGIIGGPELNEIHRQGAYTGYHFGLLAGIRFNNILTFETGLVFARKYYYSSGQYFNLQMPGKKVMSLKGSSKILEIPFKLKYDLMLRKRSSIFSSVGLISYLLTDETNDYILEVNGAEMDVTNNYPDASRYLAGAIDISAGYEYQFGKLSSVRIEPYIQIPLKGIGVGKMDILSTGIHLGFSNLFTKPKSVRFK